MSLKELRTEAGLSQLELGARLAKRLGDGEKRYFQPRISAYESGRNNIPMNVGVALVDILNKQLRRQKSKKVATLEELAQPPKKKPRR